MNEQVLFEAKLVLEKLGFNEEMIIKIINEALGIELTKEELKRLKATKVTPLLRALYYHQMWEECIDLKRRGLGCRTIALLLTKKYGIPIHYTTVARWIAGKKRPNITPLILAPELRHAFGYVVGVLVGDRARRGDGHGLAAKDKCFVDAYARCMALLTGKKIEPKRGKDRKWRTCERAAWLKHLWKTGLWKIVAFALPEDFLRGFADSEGGPIPHVRHKRQEIDFVEIELVTGSKEVFNIVKILLRKLGFTVKDSQRPGGEKEIKSQKYFFRGCYRIRVRGWNQLRMWKEKIGYHNKERLEKLEDLLSIEQLSPRERYYWWIKHYEKTPSGRWRKRRKPLP